MNVSKEAPEAITNTFAVAEMCAKLPLGKTTIRFLPCLLNFNGGQRQFDYLKNQCTGECMSVAKLNILIRRS